MNAAQINSLIRPLAAVALTATLAGCAVQPTAPGGVVDPYEAQNRQVHAFNSALTGSAARVTSGGAKRQPGEVATALGAAATNLGEPANFVNHLLQGNGHDAAVTFARATINTLFGWGGFYDVAGATGLPEEATDFGETLHVWGAPEGAYVELPVLGPSTERDMVGLAVDYFLNPLGYMLSKDSGRVATVVRITGRVLNAGQDAGPTAPGADAYARSRNTHLRDRRAELAQ